MASSGLHSTLVEFFKHNVVLISAFGVLLFCGYVAWTYTRLQHIPGPFWSKFTDIPRFYWVKTRRAQHIHIDLHNKYGDLVRMGPNMVSVGDPAEIFNIYSTTGKFVKSDFYVALQPNNQGKAMPGLFNTPDETFHRLMKKPIASIYSMSNLVTFEPYADSTLTVFFEQLDRRYVQTRQECDLGKWLQWFAFDFMGEITFSHRLGFLEHASDVDGIIGDIRDHFEAAAPIGQMPWTDYLWYKNPILGPLRPRATSPIIAFASARAQERLSITPEKAADIGIEEEDLNGRDFLSRFIEAKDKDASLPDSALTVWTTSNVLAGSDTTAILLRSIVYFLLRHPPSLHRLLAELDATPLSFPVSWAESRDLPFLDAVIKEAGRLHPAKGLPLERVVPEAGATICGKFLPQGTVVGISAWVCHRDQGVFGADAEEWRPERWVNIDGEERKRMERALLTFGAGHRSCLGKNISTLEVYKLIPTLLSNYTIELVNPDREWQVDNMWLTTQRGLDVRLSKREKAQ